MFLPKSSSASVCKETHIHPAPSPPCPILPVSSILLFPLFPSLTFSYSLVLDRAGEFGSNRKRAGSKGESSEEKMAFPIGWFHAHSFLSPLGPCHPAEQTLSSNPPKPTHSLNLSPHHRGLPWHFPNKALQNLCTYIQMHICIQKQHKKRP